MARQNQEAITTFGEVLHSSNISYSQNRSSSNDNRLMIYFQGMKVSKREKIKLEQISREYRQIPKEKDADDFACKLRLNGMPVPLLRNGYSIFNGTKYR